MKKSKKGEGEKQNMKYYEHMPDLKYSISVGHRLMHYKKG